MSDEQRLGRMKSPSDIAREWDGLAADRHRQIETSIDTSFLNILLPAVRNEISSNAFDRLLDVGCGSGHLARDLSHYGGNIVGIDVSHESIALARESYSVVTNLEFLQGDVIQWSKTVDVGTFDACVANMSLSCVADLPELALALSKLMKLGGRLVASIPHPAFWPKYWGYESESWFSYGEEVAVEARFRIGAENTDHWATHFHRPISQYINQFSSAGFGLSRIQELGPNTREPRFAVFTWIRG